MRAGVVAAVAVLLCGAAPASADHQAAGPPTSGGVGPPGAPSPGPSIDGSAVQGQTLTANTGTWETGTVVTSEWLRCDSAGANCLLTHDTDGSYTLGAADVGSRIVLRARGTDTTPVVGGFREVDSSPTSVIVAPPVNTGLPSFSGALQDDQTLTRINGDWTGTPTISFTYQWQRCTSSAPADCSNVAGATGTTYLLKPADVGNYIRLGVTGTNSGGASTAFSDPPSGPVAPITTANTASPEISGVVRQGEILSALKGTWVGTRPLTYSYRWRRCNPTCGTVVSQGASYAPAAADVGHELELTVTASGQGGTASVSVLSGTVAPRPAPGGSGGAGGGGGGGGTTGTTTPGTTTLRKLSPFPVVAIGGRVIGRRVLVSLLRVSRAPRGAVVTVTCKGRGCPFKRSRRTVRRKSGVRIRALERRLRSGTVIVIVIRKGKAIGKYTRLRIRRGAPPARIDRCIRPGARRPSACPS